MDGSAARKGSRGGAGAVPALACSDLLAFAASKLITSRARCSPELLAAGASAVMLMLPVISEMQMSLQAP